MYSGQRLDALDTRLVLKVYAMVMGMSGFLLVAYGVVEVFGSGRPSLVAIAGSTMMALACCAIGFAATDDRTARRNALFWLMVCHSIIFLVLFVQLIGPRGALPHILGSAGPVLVDRIAQGMGVVTFVLLYLWRTSEGENTGRRSFSLFGAPKPESAEQLRSQFEQQIRQSVRLEERNRLARDLHDSIKQQIFTIQTAAATAQARFDGDQGGAKQALNQIRDSAREAMLEMQAMLDQLRAEPLENASLIEAIRKQCEALEFRTGARVEFTFGKLPPSEALPPGAHHAILRVAQEALSNVARHARASKVAVSLNSSLDLVEFKVQDDGAGFDPNAVARGLGTEGMRGRAEEMRGKFELTSRPGGGTSIEFAVPYTRAEKAAEYRRNIWITAAMVSLGAIATISKPIMAGFTVISAISLTRSVIAYSKARRREVAQ